MTQYPAGPYTLSYPYIWENFAHTVEFNCDTIGDPASGTLPAEVTMRSRNGEGVPLDEAANDVWEVLRAFFNLTTLCSTYTLWQRNENNTQREFVSGGVLTTPNGSSASPNVTASQNVFTYRAAAGGILRINLLETVYNDATVTPIASNADVVIVNLNTYVMGPTNIIMARSRSFPVAPMNFAQGQNERLFRRRFRS